MSEAKQGGGSPTSITVIGGSDGTTARALRVSSDGTLTAKDSDSNVVNAGGVSLTPKFAFANVPALTTGAVIVAAVATKKIRVLAVAVHGGAVATAVTLNSAATAKTGLKENAASSIEVWPFAPVGWFETVAGEALTATTGAGAATAIQVVYIEV